MDQGIHDGRAPDGRAPDGRALDARPVDARLVDRTVRADGAWQVPITLGGSLQNPCFSPDGRTLVFTQFASGYNVGTALVYEVDVGGGTPTLISFPTGQNVNLPGSCWNAAKNEVVFSSDVGTTDEVYTVAATGGTPTQVTNRPGYQAFEPTFSPDGQSIAFESHVAGCPGNGSIWTVGAGGTALTQVTNGTGDDREPNWSAQNLLVFQSGRTNPISLWTMTPSGGSVQQLTTDGFESTDPSFSPDGRYVVYSTDRNCAPLANLYAIPSGGGTPTQVTSGGSYDGAPSWSSQGQIAFESSPVVPCGSAGTTIWMINAPPGL
jgi:TolB protein